LHSTANAAEGCRQHNKIAPRLLRLVKPDADHMIVFGGLETDEVNLTVNDRRESEGFVANRWNEELGAAFMECRADLVVGMYDRDDSRLVRSGSTHCGNRATCGQLFNHPFDLLIWRELGGERVNQPTPMSYRVSERSQGHIAVKREGDSPVRHVRLP
jgi:hypothetical protein